jgi:hypothetical protein
MTSDEVAAREAAEAEREALAQERLSALYAGMPDEVVRLIEEQRAAIKASRREQQRAEAARFRDIRDVLWMEGRYLKDWCVAAGENYRSIDNAIRYLEAAEQSQDASPENQGEQPENDEDDDPPPPTPKPKRKPKDDYDHNAMVKLEFHFHRADAERAKASLARVMEAQELASRSAALLYVLDQYEGRPAARKQRGEAA